MARRRGVYGLLFHAADSAALTALRPFVRRLWMATGCPSMQAIGGDRYYSYVSRVPEMVIQGWFAVTALVLCMDDSAKEVMPLLVSVFATCATSMKAFYETASIFVPWSRIMFATAHGPPYRTDNAWLPVRLLAFMIFHAAGLLAITARICGIWACDSHDFKVLSLRCGH